MANAFYRAVGERIAEARARAGLTQAEGAARANLNRSLLARIETGAENLSLQTLSRLALAYGVAPGAFLEGLDADPASLAERAMRVNRRGTGAGGGGDPAPEGARPDRVPGDVPR